MLLAKSSQLFLQWFTLHGPMFVFIYNLFIYVSLSFTQMGLVAAIPYLFKAFLGPLGGITADFLVRYQYLTIRGVRTLFYALGKNSSFDMLYFVQKNMSKTDIKRIADSCVCTRRLDFIAKSQ